MRGSELRVQKNTEKIMQAAIVLFQSQGIKKVSVNDIARKAGVTSATIYNRFNSKDDLVHEAVISWYRSVLVKYKQVLQTGESFQEKFHNLLTFKTDVAGKTHGEFYAVASSDDPVIRNFLESEYTQDVMRIVYQFFEEGREQGYINPAISTETILRYTELIRKGLNAEGEISDDPGYTEKLARELTPLVLYGILGKPKT